MKTTRKVIGCVFLTLAAICICSQPTFAQQEKGDKEVQLNGFIFATTGDQKIANGNIGVGLGYFITAKNEIGFGTDLTITRGGGDFSFDAGVRGFYRYNFAKSGKKAYPYIDLSMFIEDVKNAGDSTIALPSFGFKYFFKKNAAFDMNFGYGFLVKEPGQGAIIGRFGLAFIF